MKIKTNDCVYNIPTDHRINILIDNGYKEDIIECLATYCNKKKKTKCLIFDEEGDLIKYEEVSFIYLSSKTDIDDNFEFNSKSLFNNEISNIIIDNPECFTTIDLIRNCLYDMLTDRGIYQLKQILEKNAKYKINIKFSELNINNLLGSFSIDTRLLSEEDKYMCYYNLMQYLNRKAFSIVYIDFRITNDVFEWIKNNDNPNLVFFLDSNAVASNNYCANNLIIMSKEDSIVYDTIEYQDSRVLTYMFNPVIISNLAFQTNKNIEIYEKYCDQNATFSLEINKEKA